MCSMEMHTVFTGSCLIKPLMDQKDQSLDW